MLTEFRMTVSSEVLTQAETVAFGYLRERLFLNSESEGPLAIHVRRFVHGGRRPRHTNALPIILVPGSMNRRSEF